MLVSRDLRHACYATGVVTRLQQALEDWHFFAPQLQDVYDALNAGRARHAFDFEPARCLAPLPRAWLWLQGQGWPDAHPAPASRLRSGVDLRGPHGVLASAPAGRGLDVGAQLGVITGDVPARAAPAQALDGVRLLVLLASVDWPVQAPADDLAVPLLGAEDGAALRPPAFVAPVAITPDELGEAWAGGRAHVVLHSWHQGRRLGLGDAGADMSQGFDELVAQAAQSGALPAGTLVSSGTVALRTQGQGQHSLQARRASEAARNGAAHTAWLQAGEHMRFELKGRDGHSLCGGIEVSVQAPAVPQVNAPLAGEAESGPAK